MWLHILEDVSACNFIGDAECFVIFLSPTNEWLTASARYLSAIFSDQYQAFIEEKNELFHPCVYRTQEKTAKYVIIIKSVKKDIGLPERIETITALARVAIAAEALQVKSVVIPVLSINHADGKLEREKLEETIEKYYRRFNGYVYLCE